MEKIDKLKKKFSKEKILMVILFQKMMSFLVNIFLITMTG